MCMYQWLTAVGPIFAAKRPFMKKILIASALVISASVSALAQDVKYKYCQLVGERKAFSGKLTMQLDMGERYKPDAEEQKLVDEISNYNSTMDALNRLADAGWEPFLVATSPAGNGMANNYIVHTLRKKK